MAYNSTLLAQTNDPKEIQKADLDLLKKINDLQSSIDSLTDEVTFLKDNVFISDWVSYSPTLTNFTITSGATPSYKWRRVGSSIEFSLLFRGLPIGQVGLANIIPTGLTPITEDSGSPYTYLPCIVNAASQPGNIGGMVRVFHNNSVGYFYSQYPSTIGVWTATVPITWADGNTFLVTGSIKIAQWAGIGTATS